MFDNENPSGTFILIQIGFHPNGSISQLFDCLQCENCMRFGRLIFFNTQHSAFKLIGIDFFLLFFFFFEVKYSHKFRIQNGINESYYIRLLISQTIKWTEYCFFFGFTFTSQRMLKTSFFVKTNGFSSNSWQKQTFLILQIFFDFTQFWFFFFFWNLIVFHQN